MVTFRNVEDKDQQFIEIVYRSTREKELSLTNWTEDEKHRFIIMQSIAQLAEYKKNYKDAVYKIICYKNKPAGRLYLWESNHEIRVIDISLLPKFRSKGIGGKILRDIIQVARQQNKIVSLNVVRNNPAKKLYERVGFTTISTNNDRDYMECKPA